MDLMTLRRALEAEKYIFDEDFLITIFVALKLGKPLLIEGPAGVGKTEVAKALAAVYGSELIRLQCYEGLDESKALYEWNYQRQLLSIQLGISQNSSVTNDNANPTPTPNPTPTQTPNQTPNPTPTPNPNLSTLFSEEYLLERPLLKAIRSQQQSVLLIDEIDKTDEQFEAFLLELLSDFQISIPELGTVKAQSRPVVILTSNNTRQLSDALKRRCAYLYIDYPSVEKELNIINAKLPQAGKRLAEQAAAAVAIIRQNNKIYKKPSIAETLDWVAALISLDKSKLDKDGADKTVGFLLKSREDIATFKKEGGFDGIID